MGEEENTKKQLKAKKVKRQEEKDKEKEKKEEGDNNEERRKEEELLQMDGCLFLSASATSTPSTTCTSTGPLPEELELYALSSSSSYTIKIVDLKMKLLSFLERSKKIMSQYVGVVRTTTGLQKAVRSLENIQTVFLLMAQDLGLETGGQEQDVESKESQLQREREKTKPNKINRMCKKGKEDFSNLLPLYYSTRNIILTSILVAKSALANEKSSGTHFRAI